MRSVSSTLGDMPAAPSIRVAMDGGGRRKGCIGWTGEQAGF